MDPIELQIQQRINEIQNTPGFTNYQNEGIAPLSLPNLDTNFISQENNASINQNFMPEEKNTNVDLFKKATMNAARNKLIDTIAQKVGIESLPSIATPLLGNFAAAALPVLGIGALRNFFTQGGNLRNTIAAEAARDNQGNITTVNQKIANMQPTAQDTARGSMPSRSPAPSRPSSYSEAKSAFTSGR